MALMHQRPARTATQAASQQPAQRRGRNTHRHKDGVQPVVVGLAQDLGADGALARNHVGVIVGGDEDPALPLGTLLRGSREGASRVEGGVGLGHVSGPGGGRAWPRQERGDEPSWGGLATSALACCIALLHCLAACTLLQPLCTPPTSTQPIYPRRRQGGAPSPPHPPLPPSSRTTATGAAYPPAGTPHSSTPPPHTHNLHQHGPAPPPPTCAAVWVSL